MSDDTPADDAPDEETALARIDRLRASVLHAPPELLRSALASIPDSTLNEIAKACGTPVPVLRRSADPGARLRRTSDPRHLALVSEAMVQPCLELTVETLGDASEDPTYEQLTEALETTVQSHSPPEISAMLAYVAATGQAAAAVCDRVLTEDERFRVPSDDDGAGDADSKGSRPVAMSLPSGASAEQREERKKRRAAEKEERRRRDEAAAKAAQAARDRARQARHQDPPA